MDATGQNEPLEPWLLAALACPDTHHAPLEHDPASGTLTCTVCSATFQVDDGIPVLLIDGERAPAA